MTPKLNILDYTELDLKLEPFCKLKILLQVVPLKFVIDTNKGNKWASQRSNDNYIYYKKGRKI